MLNKDVYSINFKKETTERFFSEKIYLYGRLIRNTHYPYDGQDPDLNTPILKEEIDYFFNNFESVDKVRRVFTYWRNNGDSSVEKVAIKNLDEGDVISEGVERRNNIIDKMKYCIVKVLIDEGDLPAGIT